MGDLISPDDARAQVLAEATVLESERVQASEALGRCLAADVIAEFDNPPFDSSAMDGFAVQAADTKEAPARLKIVGESRAGHPARATLKAGEAIAISTGAVLPAGADAVVRIEDAETEHDQVNVAVAVGPGRDIRRAGEDLHKGDLAVARGTRLGPAELAVCAGVGHAALECHRRPCLACIATGDELIAVGEPLAAGQIHNTNGPAIAALAKEQHAEAVMMAKVGDDHAKTRATIERGLAADVLVVTGGVSVGPHDHVKSALAELGVDRIFWGVALRPGKPTWFGVRDRTLVFGLPGNPVSAMVTFHLFVRPALAALQGHELVDRRLLATFAADYRKQPGRAHVLRVKVERTEPQLTVSPTKAQGSHVLSSMVGADALAYLDVEIGDVSAGDRVPIELLPSFTA